ncbi:hypothetical protein [Hydrogenophaga electricum]|uniref:Uncharacterized protein n=1 Tax=Hydrogenophaga electricum TaxID=1230953 RepID=A0ABQ6C5H7_9BURK|nr:hypothetical protein [Hydrogenophaga electricum]GLS13611.1 hypothetical protein GCM10007935_10410 [Hydrogenophaga electricum]
MKDVYKWLALRELDHGGDHHTLRESARGWALVAATLALVGLIAFALLAGFSGAANSNPSAPTSQMFAVLLASLPAWLEPAAFMVMLAALYAGLYAWALSRAAERLRSHL